MSARTPGPKDILGNVIAHDCITFRMQGRDIPLQMLQSARDEAESYRERMIALTAQRDALAKVLRVVARGACLHQVTGNTCYCYVCMAQDAIRALADGAR